MLRSRQLLLALLLTFISVPCAWSANYDLALISNLAQSEFNTLVEEVGPAVAYRALAPAEPQGLTGFDVGASVSAVRIDSRLWDQVTTTSEFNDYLPIPTLRARKGLPFGFDVGVSYSQIPQSDIRVIGGEVQYALLQGGVATPALAVRVSGSTLLGVDDLELTTYGGDVVISKGIAFLTPYAGIGTVYMRGEYTGSDITNLDLAAHSNNEPRLFAGVQMSLTLLRLTLDYEYLQQPVYSAKLSIGF